MVSIFIKKYYSLTDVELNPGTGGAKITVDSVAGGKVVEVIKLAQGAEGALSLVDQTNPLFVKDELAEAALASIASEDFATNAAQTNGSQKTQIVDASGNPVTVTGNKLDVNAIFSGDIEIGAVELKNGTDDTRATVTPANALKVDGSAVTQPVNVTVIVPGTAATNLGKAEDTPHTTGDVGVMALAVRNDAGAALAGNDGDYVPVTTDATGALRIDMNGTVSTSNSSTAILLAAAVFTGTSEDVLNYNEIRITIYSDVASAINGLSIQQSTDNSNWVVTDTYSIAAVTGKTFSVPRQARYFRIIYINGASNQVTFILQTILNRVGTKSSSQRPGDAYTNETDLEQQQSFPMGYDNATGLWNRLRSTTSFGLEVDIKRSAGSATDNTQLYSSNIVASGAITGIDTTGYASIVIQLSGAWSAEIILEGSNDNATWNGLLVMNINELSMIDTVQSNGIFAFKTTSKFIRLNVIGFNIGAITALILGRTVLGINGADVLSLAMDKSNNAPLYVDTDNKKDSTKALIPSDAPYLITANGNVNNEVLCIIDTTGYNSIAVQLSVVFVASVTFSQSNDGITYYGVTGNAVINTVSASTNVYGTAGVYIFPAIFKYFKAQITSYTSGVVQLAAHLRTYTPAGTTQNIAFFNGIAPVTAGVGGTIAVGGNIAVGSAPTMNPIPLVIDTSGLTRRILTDTSGRFINSIDQTGTSRVAGSLSPASNIYNIPAAVVQEVSQFEGQSLIEIMAQILLEMRINNQYLSELPAILQLPNSKFDEPSTFRNDTSVFAN